MTAGSGSCSHRADRAARPRARDRRRGQLVHPAVAHHRRPAPGRRRRAGPHSSASTIDPPTETHSASTPSGTRSWSRPGATFTTDVGHPVEQRRHRRPGRRPAVGVELPPCRPPAGPGRGSAAAQPATVPAGAPRPGRRRRASRTSTRSASPSAAALAAVSSRATGSRSTATTCAPARASARVSVPAAQPRSAARSSPPASSRAARRAASSGRPACSRVSAVRKQPVGVGAEHGGPCPRTEPGQLPRRTGVLGAHLGAQPRQPGDQVGALGEQPAGERRRRGAPRRRAASQLATVVGGRASARASLREPPGCHPGTRLSGWHSRG